MERVKIFLLFFSLFYFFDATGFTYIISAVQNIEKQFQIPSKFAGFMVSASDLGYIPTVLFVSYFGSRGNRARWIGAGALLMSATYFLIASPNFIFPVVPPKANLTHIENQLKPVAAQLSPNATLGDLLHYPLIRDRIPPNIRRDLLALANDNQSFEQSATELTDFNPPSNRHNVSNYSIDGWLLDQACDEAREVLSNGAQPDKLLHALRQYVHKRPNHTTQDLFRIRRSASAPFSYCGRLVNNIRQITKNVSCVEQGNNGGPFLILFTAFFVLGIGRTVPWSIGVPLLDDNVKRKNMPAYFGGISFIRILGPIVGHLIGSFTNKLYYTLQPPRGLSPTDPTWIGAWWLGFLLVGTALLVPSVVFFFFPSGKGKRDHVYTEGKAHKGDVLEFFDKHKEERKEGNLTQRMKDFAASYKKVLSTKIYTGSVVGRVLDILAFKGYMVFMPKYLENHFGIPLYKVHQYIAGSGVIGFALGIMAGGLVTRRLKFTGRQASVFVLAVSALNLGLFFSKSFIACESIVNSVGVNNKESHYNFTKQCNSECMCDGAKLYPVCDVKGFAYYSPCHAGCREVKLWNGDYQNLEFSSCECVDGGVVKKEYCQDNCKWPTIIFFTTVFFGAMFAGMGVVPSMLILLRSVPPASRSISLGLQGLLVSLFGTLPSPVLWGFVVDSACLVWERSCPGRSGSCSIYEPHVLRMRMHVLYVSIRLVSFVTDIYVWYHAKGLKIMDEESLDAKQEVADSLQKGSIALESIPSAPQ